MNVVGTGQVARVLSFDAESQLSAVPTLSAGPGALFQGLKNGQTALIQETGFLYVLSFSQQTPDGSLVLATRDDSDRRWLKTGGGDGPTPSTVATEFPISGDGTVEDPVTTTTANLLAALALVGVEPTFASLRHPSVLQYAPTLLRAIPLNTYNVSTDWEVAAPVGTGLFQPDITKQGGVFKCMSGGTAGGVQVGRTRDAAATNRAAWVSNQKLVPWAISMEIVRKTAIFAAANSMIMGFNDATVDVGLMYYGLAGGGTTKYTLRVNGGAGTNVDTGVLFSAIDVPTILTLLYDLTSLSLLVDDVKVGTPLTDLSNFGTAACYLRSFFSNGVTSTNGQFEINNAAIFTPLPGV